MLGCYGISGKYCQKYQYVWVFLDIQVKYSWESIISLLKCCTFHKTHFALHYWQPYIFHDFSYQEYSYLDLLVVEYVNLTLWLKVYVAFNDLRILKILIVLYKWKISFKMSGLIKVCEIYWEKTKYDHFTWSKIPKFTSSTMVVTIQSSSKNILAAPLELLVLNWWFSGSIKNHWNEASPYYVLLIHSSSWSELTALFPGICIQVCPKYPKQQVYNIFAISQVKREGWSRFFAYW